jgi:hypothetical protein
MSNFLSVRIKLTSAADEQRQRLKAEREELQTLYHVSPEEWDWSEVMWRKWVQNRDTGSAPDPGRFHTPGEEAEEEKPGNIGEERFSKVVEAQHDNCLTCKAVQYIKEDWMISEEEREKRLARLAHTVPRVMPFPPTQGPISAQVPSELSLDALLNVSSWGHERAWSGHKISPLSNLEKLRVALPKADVLEPKVGSYHEFVERKEYLSATDDLLKNADASAMLDVIIRDPELRQRVDVFRQNKQMAADAVSNADSLQRLNSAEKDTYARSAAEAWELERDLVRLEKMQEAVKEQIKRAREGYTAHPYSKGRAVARKKFGIGYYPDLDARSIRYGRPGLNGIIRSDAEEEDGDEEKVKEVKEKFGKMPGVPTQAEAVELNAQPNSSPSPHNLTELPEQIQKNSQRKLILV